MFGESSRVWRRGCRWSEVPAARAAEAICAGEVRLSDRDLRCADLLRFATGWAAQPVANGCPGSDSGQAERLGGPSGGVERQVGEGLTDPGRELEAVP